MRLICSRPPNRTTTASPTLRKIKKTAAAAAEFAGLVLPNDSILSVNLVGPRLMRKINRDFLEHDRLTDVICFDYRTDSEPTDRGIAAPEDILVEIFISPNMAEIQAAERPESRSPGSELLLYMIHGILHAVGELDSTPEQRRRMRRKERSVLRKLAAIGITSL